MDDLNYNVAVNLKRIRREKGMSLEGMAEQTGVSKSMLAQIEKGIANPSLGVIGKIIGGLHIEFQELIEDVSPGSRLVHIKEMEPTKEVRNIKYGTVFLMKITVWQRFTGLIWNRGQNIPAAVRGKRQEHTFLCWKAK